MPGQIKREGASTPTLHTFVIYTEDGVLAPSLLICSCIMSYQMDDMVPLGTCTICGLGLSDDLMEQDESLKISICAVI